MPDSPRSMQLVLIRHGESEWNRLNLFTRLTDVDLSKAGRSEAAEGGRALAREGFDFDICYTSRLKRAIHTLDIVLDELDRAWLPVVKAWELNERHYGALQGLDKAETAARYGEEQVRIWRRSFDVEPPALEAGDARDPHGQAMYRDVPAACLPTLDRVLRPPSNAPGRTSSAKSCPSCTRGSACSSPRTATACGRSS